MNQYILAHDFGTTGDKAALFHPDGYIVESCSYEYPTYYPKHGWAEQDPQHYWKAFCESTQSLFEKSGVSAKQIAAVSFSAQMQAALPVDKSGKALRNAIIWMDMRSSEETQSLKNELGADKVYEITGHQANASYSAAKIRWIKNNEPEIYKKTSHFLHVKDYIILRLTGNALTDYSDGSGMNLLDLKRLDWSDDILHALDIDRDKLPPLLSSIEKAGEVKSDAAKASGLIEGTPVILGGGDGACATTGAGAVSGGSAYIYVGTSTWMAAASSKPSIDPQKRTVTFCHMQKGMYFSAGTMQVGGGAFQWFKNSLGKQEQQAAQETGLDPYQLLNLQAEKVPAGSEGLVFLPHLMGERAPYWNAEARGAFLGLSLTHGKEHMTRAVLEGVAYNIYLINEAFEDQGIHSDSIRIIGGGAKSLLWRQIFADVLQRKIQTLNFIENATTIGAALAGGVGIGLYDSLETGGGLMRVTSTQQPDTENKEKYQKAIEIYRKSYQQLLPIYSMLKKS
ncbi:MAG: xylulokinase [Spirochaetales bacterium]|nr:xylulokinase [Spirochaetales bacterium]